MDVIVSVDKNWAIGRDGQLLFHLSADLRRFRALTLGHTVLLGRKTLSSFPGGLPLPGRRSVVLSSCDIPGAQTVHSLHDLLDAADDHSFLIGGGSVYAALLDRCSRAYVTHVDAAVPDADTWFPPLDQLPHWSVESAEPPISQDGLSFRFVTWINHLPQ